MMSAKTVVRNSITTGHTIVNEPRFRNAAKLRQLLVRHGVVLTLDDRQPTTLSLGLYDPASSCDFLASGADGVMRLLITNATTGNSMSHGSASLVINYATKKWC
jgi:hypothetical protein